MSKVKEIIAILYEITKGESGDIGEDSMLFNEGIIDSMEILDLLSSIEEKYEIKISSEDLNSENFSCVRAITNLVEKYKQ